MEFLKKLDKVLGIKKRKGRPKRTSVGPPIHKVDQPQEPRTIFKRMSLPTEP